MDVGVGTAVGTGVGVGVGVGVAFPEPPWVDQLGPYRHTPSYVVRRVWSEPSAFITYISSFPSRFDWNTMRRPSGDQLGCTVGSARLYGQACLAGTVCVHYVYLRDDHNHAGELGSDSPGTMRTRCGFRRGTSLGPSPTPNCRSGVSDRSHPRSSRISQSLPISARRERDAASVRRPTWGKSPSSSHVSVVSGPSRPRSSRISGGSRHGTSMNAMRRPSGDQLGA